MATFGYSWNFMDPASKATVLEVLQREVDATFDLVDNPARWEAPTACEGWQVRDIVGHLVDATEGYLPNFDLARAGSAPIEPLGLRAMAARADEHAKSFRKVPREEMIGRLRDAYGRARGHFESLTADDWTSLMVGHPYMGPVPAMFYPMFQLVDYTVHSWDVREGTGVPHAIDGDAADLLVPVIFILWQATADTAAVDAPYTVGVRTSGRNGSEMRLDVTPEGLQFAPGSVDDCAAILEFDPASFVLTAYGRMNGGTVRGGYWDLAGRFRTLFFPI